jgi:hypothetical protein
MKRLTILAIAFLALAAGEGTARAEQAMPVRNGTGTFEVRIQTASAVAGGGVLGVASTPGLAYGTDTEILVINVLGGIGYFLTPSLALGGDLGYSHLDDGSSLDLITLAPFVKFVTGLPEKDIGFFIEGSPGIVLARAERASGTVLLQLSAWLGAHLPVGTSAGFLVGPFVTRLDDTEDFGGGEFILGVRFGMSIYL